MVFDHYTLLKCTLWLCCFFLLAISSFQNIEHFQLKNLNVNFRYLTFLDSFKAWNNEYASKIVILGWYFATSLYNWNILERTISNRQPINHWSPVFSTLVLWLIFQSIRLYEKYMYVENIFNYGPKVVCNCWTVLFFNLPRKWLQNYSVHLTEIINIDTCNYWAKCLLQWD